MLKFNNNIVQFGFGAVGKSFFEKLSKEIDYNENNYYVVTKDKTEFAAYINLGGIAQNFFIYDINEDNFIEVFSKFLHEGDLLIDFADSVGTTDILKWCADNNIMYINTGEAAWPNNWYSIFDENTKKQELIDYYKNEPNLNKVPIVLQHGNNPGLVSHFVKSALEYIVTKQFKKDKYLKKLLKENKFNEIADYLDVQMIHVNDIDLQIINEEFNINKLISTWCIDSFFFELLSEATQNVGTHEMFDDEAIYNLYDKKKGYLEYKKLAKDIQIKTQYPNGYFEGYLVPHEETITIANFLSVKERGKTIYRPSVMFVYSPCELAKKYLYSSKVDEHSNFISDNMDSSSISIVRGHVYPKNQEIVYQEKIKEGTEYVGVLLIGKKFNPVWVGNKVELNYLYKSKKQSFWQTPTITPVAMSALSAVKWMIENKEQGGIYFPDDIKEYKKIIKTAEKYISKTIYKQFTKKDIESSLNIKINNIKSQDFFV